MIRMHSLRAATAAAFALTLALLPATARAQGNLSVQGFGYPTGQLSTRSLATGGALGEIDPLSAINPAVIGNLGGSMLYFQLEPEYRTLHVNGSSERTSVARYPIVAAAIPVTESVMFGLSFSSLLDRSFETTTRGLATVGDSTLASTNVFKSNGAIGDVRAALAWSPVSWLHAGVAAHAITGDNRLTSTQTFDDSTRFARLVDTATVGYTGKAVSAGLEVVLGGQLSVAGSFRRGGVLTLKRGDTTITKANVPDRISGSVAYLGIKGTSIAVRTSKDSWSRMAGLGSAGLRITDSWDTSAGADVLGPRIGGNLYQLRVGVRQRTLPFGISGSDVKERSYSFGTGTLLARGRAALDLTGIRATRTTSGSLTGSPSESAWTLSVGLTVRP